MERMILEPAEAPVLLGGLSISGYCLLIVILLWYKGSVGVLVLKLLIEYFKCGNISRTEFCGR